MKIYEKLIAVQSALKAPKNQRNSFGNYNYRSCEDILEAVKPLLKEQNLLLTISDEVLEIGGRVYVRAMATIHSGEEKHIVSAFSREAETKKGMDDSQITGATSSYARKYALNGLFCIDDTKDTDTDAYTKKTTTTTPTNTNTNATGEKPWLNKKDIDSEAFSLSMKRNKEAGKAWKEVLIAIREKWAVSTQTAGMLEDIYNNL